MFLMPDPQVAIKGDFSTAAPHPPHAASVPESGYKSLGSLFGSKTSSPSFRESKKKPSNTKNSVMIGNSAERSYSVSESAGNARQKGGVVRTPHRSAGLGGGGQPNKGLHRFGNADTRASYSERLSSRQKYSFRGLPAGTINGEVYKSNSSLDLDHEIDFLQEASAGGSSAVHRREFGSHGSLDVMGSRVLQQDTFLPPSSGYPTGGHPAGGFPPAGAASLMLVGGGVGPAAVSTLNRAGSSAHHHLNHLNRSEESYTSGASNGSSYSNAAAPTQDLTDGQPSSPKQPKKKGGMSGFWSSGGSSSNNNVNLNSGVPSAAKSSASGSGSSRKSQKGLFKKRGGAAKDASVDDSFLTGGSRSDQAGGKNSLENGGVGSAGDVVDNRAEDKHRRRFFSHYDIGSVCASLSVTARLRTLHRRNTTTGASAASNALRNSGVDSPEGEEADQGDGISNELVLSCPYFRNEIGGEDEKVIALTRETGRTWGCLPEDGDAVGVAARPPGVASYHTPRLARGFCLLEQAVTNTQSSHWKTGLCPYASGQITPVLERTDAGSTYYKHFFYGKDHQDWFGEDDKLGPVAVSIRREKVVHAATANRGTDNNNHHTSNADQYMYRLIVRTSELLSLRGTVLEDSIPALGARTAEGKPLKAIPTKEVLEFCFPELQLSSLHLGVQSGPCEEQLVKLDEQLDEQCSEKTYKVGVMYCRAGQQTEEEMYNNEEGGPAFQEFLDLIGQRVRLKGFNKYKAGLCNKNDSTGLYSVYTEFESNEIMFHVSTLLPFTPNNRQQLPRKRYIGNDIVTVVFQEPGALPFIPNIRSHFQHVFIIVRAHNPCSDNTQYSIAVSRSKNVPMFGPPIHDGAVFNKSPAFTKFLLTKIINAEHAAHRSDKFVSMATRTRQEYLKDLATNYVTQTTLDSGSKFALFAPKKKSVRPRFSPDASLKGALSWAVLVEDCTTNQQLEAFIAISSDTLIIIQDNTHRDILFIAPCRSILGWSATHNSIRIFYHQGECIIVHSKDWESVGEDMTEIAARLKSVTPGAACQEFSLRRNQLGQLGFHVQHDGLITEVENFGYAWQTGLRQGSRLVEICKHPVTTLTHQQMVDLLKTSLTVTVTVIPPHPDGSPRQGCDLPNCAYAFGGFEGDYENVNGEGEKCVSGSGGSGGHPTMNGVGSKPGSRQAPTNGGKMRYERSLSPPRSSSSSGYGTGSSSKSFLEGTNNNNSNNNNNRFPGGQMEAGLTSSSSSGQSIEERWYDFMDQPPSSENSPPPLPTRIGSKTSAFHKVVQQQPPATGNSSQYLGNRSSPEYQHPPAVSPYAVPPSNAAVVARNSAGDGAAKGAVVVGPSQFYPTHHNKQEQDLQEKLYPALAGELSLPSRGGHDQLAAGPGKTGGAGSSSSPLNRSAANKSATPTQSITPPTAAVTGSSMDYEERLSQDSRSTYLTDYDLLAGDAASGSGGSPRHHHNQRSYSRDNLNQLEAAAGSSASSAGSSTTSPRHLRNNKNNSKTIGNNNSNSNNNINSTGKADPVVGGSNSPSHLHSSSGHRRSRPNSLMSLGSSSGGFGLEAAGHAISGLRLTEDGNELVAGGGGSASGGSSPASSSHHNHHQQQYNNTHHPVIGYSNNINNNNYHYGSGSVGKVVGPRSSSTSRRNTITGNGPQVVVSAGGNGTNNNHHHHLNATRTSPHHAVSGNNPATSNNNNNNNTTVIVSNNNNNPAPPQPSQYNSHLDSSYGPPKKKIVNSMSSSYSAATGSGGSSSTFQEDLLRLIGPDSLTDETLTTATEGRHNVSSGSDGTPTAGSDKGGYADAGSDNMTPLSKHLPKKTMSELSLLKSRSRDNIVVGRMINNAGESDAVSAAAGYQQQPPTESSSQQLNNVSFGSNSSTGGHNYHTARPVTVISGSSIGSKSPGSPSSAAGTASHNNHPNHISSVSIVNNHSMSTGSVVGGDKPAGGGGDMDWTSLVDTATKAIFTAEDDIAVETATGGSAAEDKEPTKMVKRLLERVTSLEQELAGERKGKEDLASQVEQLKEENVRLQEESQTAAQQLRRFTEWFFQTIDKS